MCEDTLGVVVSGASVLGIDRSVLVCWQLGCRISQDSGAWEP